MMKTALSLYSGAGGLDLGISAAGFNVVRSVEQDADCCATLLRNGVRGVRQLAVEDFSATDELRAEGIPAGELDLLFGGPPCQPFSKSAHWTRSGPIGVADPRASTLMTFLKLVEELRPRAVLLENVEGFSRNGGLKLISDGLQAINERAGTSYLPAGGLVNAADFGVPQMRKRYFLVALRTGARFEFPGPTHGEGMAACTSPWAAFHGLGQSDETLILKGRWADLLPSIPEGKNYLWHTPRGGGRPLFGWRTRYWSFLYKLARDRPSPTIVASPSQNTGPYHWDNRLLSTQELGRLQTFPIEYKFVGDRASRQRQIGNAVPPLLAEHLDRALVSALGGEVGGALKYSIDQADRPSAAAPVAEVPAKYLHLVGPHPDHPGTGRGPKGRDQTATLLQAAE